MKYQMINDIKASQIIFGCMRISHLSNEDINRLIHTALDQGINFFDHADIYGGGMSETRFAESIDLPAIRDKIVLQSKCGIRQGFYDLSKDYILTSVDQILSRLNTDYLDTLLLHRPDALVEPEEVAEAFRILKDSGKVRHFGVSNHNAGQIQLLERYLDEKLVINQLQLSITNSTMVDVGLNVNMENNESLSRDGHILDYCRLHDITIQAWSPFQYGFFEGIFLDNDKFPELNRVLQDIAETHNVSKTAIATAWILRHPANIQMISGTTKPYRLEDISRGTEIELSRQEWYEIYRSTGKMLP